MGNAWKSERALLVWIALAPVWTHHCVGQNLAKTSEVQGSPLALEECIRIALENNHERKVAEWDVAIADAMHRQARSSYWPTISGEIVATRMDEDPLFVFPSASFGIPALRVPVPAMTIPVPSQTVSVPARSFGLGLPPNDVSVSSPPMEFQTPPSSITVPPQAFPVPEQDIKVMDRDNMLATLSLTLPVFTGGKRSGIIRQAQAGVGAANEALRRTEHEVVYEIRRLYYGVITAGRVVKIAEDTLARLETTLDLTEQMYKTGSGTVKKTDFLRNKAIVETVRTFLARASAEKNLAADALVFQMGWESDRRVVPSDPEVPFEETPIQFAALLDAAYESNPVLARVDAGIRAAEAKITEARSGHIPKLALIANASHIENSLDTGLVNSQNVDSWMIGAAIRIPIFEGGLVRNEVREARAELSKLERRRRQLHEGIALQLKQAVYDVERSRAQHQSSMEGLRSSTENRKLNIRAYQEELVETKDVIEAQLLEAFLDTAFQKILYDHIEGMSRVDLVIGREIPD
jgi:outer membrane protein TolC